MNYIYTWGNILSVVAAAMILVAVLPYTETNYWLNVLGITAWAFIWQIFGVYIYRLWHHFKKQ